MYISQVQTLNTDNGFRGLPLIPVSKRQHFASVKRALLSFHIGNQKKKKDKSCRITAPGTHKLEVFVIFFFLKNKKIKSHCGWVKVLVTQSCPTFFDSIDCCPPGSSVHEILQARILEPWPSRQSFPSPGIFPTQRSNPSPLHCRQILYYLSH